MSDLPITGATPGGGGGGAPIIAICDKVMITCIIEHRKKIEDERASEREGEKEREKVKYKYRNTYKLMVTDSEASTIL